MHIEFLTKLQKVKECMRAADAMTTCLLCKLASIQWVWEKKTKSTSWYALLLWTPRFDYEIVMHKNMNETISVEAYSGMFSSC